MNQLLIEILGWAYSISGIVCVIAYWPTIKDLMHHKKKSANITSYILWTVCMGVAFLYAIIALPDLPFIIVSGLNFIACAVVLFYSIKIRYL